MAQLRREPRPGESPAERVRMGFSAPTGGGNLIFGSAAGSHQVRAALEVHVTEAVVHEEAPTAPIVEELSA